MQLKPKIGIGWRGFWFQVVGFWATALFGSVGSIGSRMSTKYIDNIVFPNVEDDKTVNRAP